MVLIPGGNIASDSRAVPAPVGGWNARDPLDSMDPRDAIRLDNFFPDVGNVRLRKGYQVHATGMGTGAVETLAEFSAQDGTRQLIAGANSKLYNATSTGTATELDATTYSSNRWQTVNYRNRLWLCNGEDAPRVWDGSAIGATTFTGPTAVADLIDVTAYNNRIYFVEKDTASVWYAPSDDVITGTLVEFDVQSLLSRGGNIQWVSSWSRDSGSGSQDLLVICSNMGELLVYQGVNPGDSSWALFGRFFLPIPLGRRSKAPFGSDLLVITEQGVYPLSEIFKGNEEVSLAVAQITNKIQFAFREAAAQAKNNFGWQGIFYPESNYLLINVPVSSNTNVNQYVLNTFTGAWCRFTGQQAASWSLLNEKLYFGNGTGGKIYQANTGSIDDTSAIPAKLKTAFNYLDDRVRTKRFLMSRPLIKTDASLTFKYDVDIDFQDKLMLSEVTIQGTLGAEWDVASWDVDDWASSNVFNRDWRSVTGLGRNVALRVEGTFQNVNVEMSAFNIIYETGGLL